MTDTDREKLHKRIEDSPLRRDTVKDLTSRLKVASHNGVAHVVRDFEDEMLNYRKQYLQSHRRFHEGKMPSPNNKMMVCLDVK